MLHFLFTIIQSCYQVRFGLFRSSAHYSVMCFEKKTKLHTVGSENQPLNTEYRKHVNTKLFEVQISNGLEQMIGLCAKSYVLVSNTIPVHEKTRWCPFVRYSNGMAGIQIPDHLMSNLFWTI